MTPSQYNRLNELLSRFSTLNAVLEAAEAEIKTVQLAAAQDLLPKHAQAKVELSNIESQIRTIADASYDDLFGTDDKRTHKTPFGDIKYHKSSSIEFDDAEKVLLKIKIACDRELARAEAAGEQARFTYAQLVRTHEEPNLSALDQFDDAQVTLFGCVRQHKDTFKVVPFGMRTDKPKKNGKESK
jgi:hypothetical protein